jgi:hypothetical protein
VKNTLKNWYLMHDVHPNNIDSVSEATLRAQLRVRFMTEADRDHWIDHHVDGEIDAANVEDLRKVLRHVLHFAATLNHCIQPLYCFAESYIELDGRRRRYKFMRDIELFVLCILHAEMRVGEKILTLLLIELRLRTDLPVSVKKERWHQVSMYYMLVYIIC